MTKNIQAIRGMRDLLPDETPLWQELEEVSRELLRCYGYEEIRIPLLENTALFERSIGEATDIVEKEMYTFTDRNGDSLTLRPEGTAGCVRAGLQHGLFRNQTQRLWYCGPMFRHERPQKGRYRQFHQIGVEAFGFAGPDIDAELIIMTSRLWRMLGVGELRLELNTLGTSETRRRYRDALIEYFTAHEDKLDEDSRRRLQRSPLRILDSKEPGMQPIIQNAPGFEAYLDEDSAIHFRQLKSILEANDVPFTENQHLVRGLDYYSRTVFEWISTELGAQGTVCGGGRYDGLVSHFGGQPTPAAGFAIGMDRLIDLMGERNTTRKRNARQNPHIYLIAVGDSVTADAFRVSESLRDAFPGIQLVCHCGGGNFKRQFKHADRSGAPIALVLGENEIANQEITVKDLRSQTEQVTMPQAALADYLGNAFQMHGIAFKNQ